MGEKSAAWDEDNKPTSSTETTTTTTSTDTGTSGTTPATSTSSTGAYEGGDIGLTNIDSFTGQRAADPYSTMTNEEILGWQTPEIDPDTAGTNIDPNDPKYQMDPGALNQQAQTVQNTATAAEAQKQDAKGYDATKTQNAVAQEDMTGVQGQVSDGAIIDNNEVPQIDVASIASGFNPDGTTNATGQALQDYAELKLDDVDARATVKGQLEQLQADFTGPNGEPKIPIYAQGAAREISRIAAFKGMTGTAATAAMATAMMESSIQVANADAQFYQTVSLQNLNNKQQATIQRAGVLANMELQNADARTTAAIQNAQAFLAMDMKNLDNAQQAAVINNQNRVQSILEDAKAENAAKAFNAQSENEMTQFYDSLNSSIRQFNANSVNTMAQFNTGEVNKMSQFNAELENNREQFYQQQQFAIDTANAQWRQTVATTNTQMQFEAAAFDVKNAIDMSQEALNQLWDRSDSLLDYAWQSSEKALDRATTLAVATLQAESAEDAADSAGLGSVLGSITGSIAGSDQFLNFLF